MVLLRCLGVLVLFTGVLFADAAAAQAGGAPADRASRKPSRDVRAEAPRRAAAPTPAERVSRSLERDMRGDRFRDAAQDARGEMRPTRPEVQQFEPQRRSLQPDVGRPEQSGVMSPRSAPGTSGVGTNEQR